MQSKIYASQERFQSSQYWQDRLLALWPWEIFQFFSLILENKDPVAGEMNFHIGMQRALSEHGYFNLYLNDNDHQVALDSAAGVAEQIRKIFPEPKDRLERYEQAFAKCKEMGELYGWPSVTFKILNGENHLVNQLILDRIEGYAVLATKDHAHVVLDRIEALTNTPENPCRRLGFGDINSGTIYFVRDGLQCRVIQVDSQTLELSVEGMAFDLQLLSRINDNIKTEYDLQNDDRYELEYRWRQKKNDSPTFS